MKDIEVGEYVRTKNGIIDKVERFGTLIGVTLKPVLEKISEQIENMSEEDVEKFTNKVEKLLKRVK